VAEKTRTLETLPVHPRSLGRKKGELEHHIFGEKNESSWLERRRGGGRRTVPLFGRTPNGPLVARDSKKNSQREAWAEPGEKMSRGQSSEPRLLAKGSRAFPRRRDSGEGFAFTFGVKRTKVDSSFGGKKTKGRGEF